MLNDCLASASAVGLFSSSSAHHFSTSVRSALRGTTLFTRPIASASSAEYWRQRYQISRAFFSPTTRARKPVPWPASTLPTRGPVCPKTALSDAMERSQSTWSTWPPPMAKPLTMAMTGFGMWRMALCSASTSIGRWSIWPAAPDDPREAQHSAVRDEPVPRGAQADHGVGGGEAQVAGERQLEPAADRVPVQHRERDLRHVFEAVQRADPVAVERLADGSGRQRLPVHARGERPAGTTYDDESDGGIGSRRLRVVGERSGE